MSKQELPIAEFKIRNASKLSTRTISQIAQWLEETVKDILYADDDKHRRELSDVYTARFFKGHDPKGGIENE